jgi:hypothetical protein
VRRGSALATRLQDATRTGAAVGLGTGQDRIGRDKCCKRWGEPLLSRCEGSHFSLACI